MTPIQNLLRAANAILLTDGWEVIEELGTGRAYARGGSVLTMTNQTTACIVAGYVRQSDLAGRPNARDLLVGYDGPDAVCVISFRAEVDSDGQVRLSETVAEEGGRTALTTELPATSFASFCETVTVRTDAEVARYLAGIGPGTSR
jgi:hypothetical protein